MEIIISILHLRWFIFWQTLWCYIFSSESRSSKYSLMSFRVCLLFLLKKLNHHPGESFSCKFYFIWIIILTLQSSNAKPNKYSVTALTVFNNWQFVCLFYLQRLLKRLFACKKKKNLWISPPLLLRFSYNLRWIKS